MIKERKKGSIFEKKIPGQMQKTVAISQCREESSRLVARTGIVSLSVVPTSRRELLSMDSHPPDTGKTLSVAPRSRVQ